MSRKNFSKAHGRAVLPGQIWMPPGRSLPWRVMAVAEGCVMGRYKGCVPGVVYVKDMTEWRLAEQQEAGK